MENASKALIIAGAILISILIISLGIMVYQNAKGVIDNASIDGMTVEQFNQKFLSYCGDKKSGVNVKSMITSVQQHNKQQSDDSTQVEVYLSKGVVGGADKVQALSKPGVIQPGTLEKIKMGKYYKVEYQTSDAGYINELLISNVSE